MTVPLVVGNWKMNGTQSECRRLARNIMRGLPRKKARRVEVALSPPFTALSTVAKTIEGSKIKLAAQNCHWQESGAFTGEISARMVAELGCDFVIVGHSERRHVFREDDELIARKIPAVYAQGMRAILCVGETLAERQANQTVEVITRQLSAALKGLDKDVIHRLEIAYEPVWAIGTGHNATAEQIRDVHIQIRQFLNDSFDSSTSRCVRILYGGSVKPDNAAMLAQIDELDGLLVGGASLKAESFLPIVSAFTSK
jgi:triosephosphate isomerase (TIM)